jgi:catechol 2,3-dioxygenase-like lactoylglutathione lyase family enzyme
MKIKVISVYVDDQDKALCFYTEVLGFVKKTDFSQGPYRWLTVASPEEPDGTELQLAFNGNRFIAWGAAGWHISFDMLERLLAGTPIGRILGADAMKFEGWQRLVAEYAEQFGVETPKWPPKAAQEA